MEKCYERNIPAISEEEQQLLMAKKVLVIGCGGLGGYVIEYLARLGVGHLTVVDGDVFESSNLNRQLYSTPDLIGHSKAAAAALRVKSIAPSVSVHSVEAFFDETNADDLISGHDLVIDALDNLSSRLLLEDACERQNVTFVHGAILGWKMQITVGHPGQHILHHFYETTEDSSNSVYKTSLSMTPAACAAIETAEALKLLTGHPSSLEGKLLIWDLQTMHQLMIPVD